MKLSMLENKEKNNLGFTIVELVIVIAGLSILGSFAIPNVLNTLKLNKIEEAKALMNGYASDCLSQKRLESDDQEYRKNARPNGFDNDRLGILGYQVDGNKSKCSNIAIKPKDKNDKFLFPFEFKINDNGVLTKIGTPPNPTTSNKSARNACVGWAGANCGLSAEQLAEIARLEKLARSKSDCISKYRTWLTNGNSGEFKSWDSQNQTCTKKVWAFEGTPVSSSEAVETALKAKYGKACADWKRGKMANKNYKSPKGNSETKNPECGGVPYWFHSGRIFTSKSDWTEEDNRIKKQACINDRNKALSNNKQGKYVYGPTPGPDPCGKVVWLCRGQETTSISAYNTTPCVQEVLERERKQREEAARKKAAEEARKKAEEEKKKKQKEVYKDKYTNQEKKCPDTKPRLCNNPRRAAGRPECKCWL